MARQWSPAEILALAAETARVDLATGCSIAYGCGRSRAWAMYRAGELDFPALRCGRRVVVPVAPLLRLLGLDESSGDDPPERTTPAGSSGPLVSAPRTTPTATTEVNDEQRSRSRGPGLFASTDSP
jgi:hypothetical protein